MTVLENGDRLIVKKPVQEFEEFVKRKIQVQSKFDTSELDLYFEVLEEGKKLLEEV